MCHLTENAFQSCETSLLDPALGLARQDLWGLGVLTRLTWLIHTPVLPSNWLLDKIFVLAGELGQVHMANKKFPIFLHAGRVKREGERSLQLSISFITKSSGPN